MANKPPRVRGAVGDVPSRHVPAQVLGREVLDPEGFIENRWILESTVVVSLKAATAFAEEGNERTGTMDSEKVACCTQLIVLRRKRCEV